MELNSIAFFYFTIHRSSLIIPTNLIFAPCNSLPLLAKKKPKNNSFT